MWKCGIALNHGPSALNQGPSALNHGPSSLNQGPSALFWKTMKHFLSDKCNNASKISLVHKNNVISEDQELANTFNDFFEKLWII